MGPLDIDGPGNRRHRRRPPVLQRLSRTVLDEDAGVLQCTPATRRPTAFLHRTVKVVGGTCSTCVRHRGRPPYGTRYPRGQAGHGGRRGHARAGRPLVLMVAPFAPRIAEDSGPGWVTLASLAYEPFPQVDQTLAAGQVVTLPVGSTGRPASG